MIDVFADSRRKGVCRSCGAQLEWATVVKSGKAMPFNPPLVVTQTQSSLIGGTERAIHTVDSAVSTSHFATCPQATAWRRRQAKARR